MTEKTSGSVPGPGWEPIEDQEPPGQRWGPRLLAAGLALVAAAVFVAQNSARVETEFLMFSGTPRLWVVIVVSLLLGAIGGQAVPAFHRWRRERKLARERKESAAEHGSDEH